jgi:hypothetical protein
VGVPASNNHREPEPGEKGEPLSNATIAYLMTNGVPEHNVPARPFLAPGIRRAETAIKTAFKAATIAGLAGDLGKADANLDLAGFKAETAAKLVIAEGIPPPLAPATVAARARKNAPKTGRKATAKEQAAFNALYYEAVNLTGDTALPITGSPTTPLDDTGALLKSITHVVEKN